MKIIFDTDPYVASHGHSPKGYGSWAFGTKRSPDVGNEAECWFSPSSTYSEAKKWAAAKAKAEFEAEARRTLYVLP